MALQANVGLNPLRRKYGSKKFEKHDIVKLSNLQAKPEWNDAYATIVAFNKKKDRYVVEIPSTDAPFTATKASIKSSNISLIYPAALISPYTCCFVCRSAIYEIQDCVSCPSCFGPLYCSTKCRDKHMDASYVVQTRFHSDIDFPLDLHSTECARRHKGRLLLLSQHLPRYHSMFAFDVRADPRWYDPDDATQQGKMRHIVKVAPKTVIKGWREFYQHYSLNCASKAAITYNYIMSVYHVLTKYLHLKPGRGSKQIVVHLIGCEEEETCMDFTVLLDLLPGYNFVFCFFGPELKISDLMHHEMTKAVKHYKSLMNDEFVDDVNLSLTGNGCYHRDLFFHKNTCNFAWVEYYTVLYSAQIVPWLLREQYQRPDVVIGLNMGFTAYPFELQPVYKYIKQERIPAVFTEWSVQDMWIYECMGFEMDVNLIPNPFRSPMIEPVRFARGVRIDNAYICGLNVAE
mmetsp:Transcript_70053/g.111410  ORF Transcript_70053/g.111410 Transcript_70053/m.111410 type:complete len:459 (-) Transcript_70053:172-1548(-)